MDINLHTYIDAVEPGLSGMKTSLRNPIQYKMWTPLPSGDLSLVSYVRVRIEGFRGQGRKVCHYLMYTLPMAYNVMGQVIQEKVYIYYSSSLQFLLTLIVGQLRCLELLGISPAF